MSKQSIAIIAVFAALVCAIIVLMLFNSAKNETISSLERRIALFGTEAPAVVTITDDTVTLESPTQYTTRYKPPEGKVTFDAAKYREVVSRLDSLLRERADSTSHVGITLPGRVNVPGDTASQHTEARLRTPPLRDLAIDSLRLVVQFPERYGILNIQTRGFCVRPMIGCGYDGEFDGVIGVKIAFWNRYGAIVGSTRKQAGIGITRRVDDILPFTHNTEAMVMYGVPYKKYDGNVFFGIGVGL